MTVEVVNTRDACIKPYTFLFSFCDDAFLYACKIHWMKARLHFLGISLGLLLEDCETY